jgi:hypothetical protein
MKYVIIIAMILAILLIASQFMTNISVEKTNQQPYKLIKKEDDIEIRHYQASVMASVRGTETTYKESSNKNFRKLASYIFGANNNSEKISMTSPVYMDWSSKGSSMSFVMPNGYNLENLPKPIDGEITLHETKPVFVAAIKYGGFSSDQDFETNKKKLSDYLARNGIKYSGNFKFLGYNPPYQLINRRNEVVVEIEWI